MRARIVFHDGTSEKPDNVRLVSETHWAIVLTLDTTEQLIYSKDRVAFFQTVWHS